MNKELIATFSKKGKGNKTSVLLVEKVESDGEIKKNFKFINDPDFHFWKSKKPLDIYQTTVSLDKVEEVHCKYSNLSKTIAEITNRQDFYNRCIEQNKLSSLRKLHNHKDIHRSDIDIQDYMIFKYNRENRKFLKNFNLQKGLFDIEVDIFDYDDGFPEPEKAPCPINFISYIDNKTLEMRMFCLFMPTNENQKEFFNKYKGDSENLWTDENNEWTKKTHKEHFSKMKSLKVYWFKSELNLIKKFYSFVHRDKADYLCAFNAYFDLKTIEQRLIQLGDNPSDVMCPEEFPLKKVYLKEDTYSVDLDDKSDTLDVAGWGSCIDLRFAYLAKRKGQGKLESTKLGDILLNELGESKFELTTSIKEEAYANYENFFLYSGYDSYRMFELEEQNMDVDLIHLMFNMLYTRQSKVFRKNICIINLMSEFYLSEGEVISNNRNKFIEHESLTDFKGAFVASSELVNPVGININGQQSKTVFNDTIDQDFTGLYPAIISAFQVGDKTLMGKIMTENPFLNEYFGELINEKDYIHIGNSFFGMPTFSDVLENIESLLKD